MYAMQDVAWGGGGGGGGGGGRCTPQRTMMTLQCNVCYARCRMGGGGGGVILESYDGQHCIV